MSEVFIECWNCHVQVTLAERSEEDGFCPHCVCELDLDDYLEQSVAAIDQLRADNERLVREVNTLKAEASKLSDAPKLYEAVERACSDIPEGWTINICMEKGAGWVELYDEDGIQVEDFPTNNERIDYTVNDAIDAALAGKGGDV